MQVRDINTSGNRVGLDFDGVLCHYRNGWTGPIPTEEPIAGALEFVRWLIEHGYNLFVFSSRALPGHEGGASGIRAWLCQHGFPDLYVTHEKIPALFYIDDRGVRFEGDYEPIKVFIKSDLRGTPWERRLR